MVHVNFRFLPAPWFLNVGIGHDEQCSRFRVIEAVLENRWGNAVSESALDATANNSWTVQSPLQPYYRLGFSLGARTLPPSFPGCVLWLCRSNYICHCSLSLLVAIDVAPARSSFDWRYGASSFWQDEAWDPTSNQYSVLL